MKSLSLVSILLVFFLVTNCMDKTKKAPRKINTDLTKIEDSEIEIDNSIGVITLSDEYNKQDTIKIYNEDGSLWYKFSYLYDDSNGEYDFYNQNFSPLAFHPDYFLLALKVSGIEKNRYEVIVNEHTRLKKYIKKEESFLKYENWKEHILNVYAIDFDAEHNPLSKEPNKQATNIPYISDNFYRPRRIEGNWLQVMWEEKKVTHFGWLKWKEDGKLLIELLYLN